MTNLDTMMSKIIRPQLKIIGMEKTTNMMLNHQISVWEVLMTTIK